MQKDSKNILEDKLTLISNLNKSLRKPFSIILMSTSYKSQKVKYEKIGINATKIENKDIEFLY